MGHAYELIESDRDLLRACNRLGGAASVALDTEFARERTYTPRLGLVQISDGEHYYLVDPQPIGSLSPLWDLLHRPEILKILHAPREDLEIFFRLSGKIPRPLFDTQLAAAFLGYGNSVSYQGLVRDVLGEDVPKLVTRTDWLRRPLSREQLDYAVLDVVHLHPMHAIFDEKLRERSREGWLREEMGVFENLSFDEDSLAYYRRVKQAWKLNRRQLGILQVLCVWREDEAFERDCPRSSVVPDDALVDLARIQPGHPNELRRLKRIHPREIDRSGRKLVEKVKEGLALSDDELPRPVDPPITDPAILARVDFLSSALRIRGMELEISPELLAKKRDLERFVKRFLEGEDDPFPEGLRGWRRTAIGDTPIRVLEGRVAFRIQPDPEKPPLEVVEFGGDGPDPEGKRGN